MRPSSRGTRMTSRGEEEEEEDEVSAATRSESAETEESDADATTASAAAEGPNSNALRLLRSIGEESYLLFLRKSASSNRFSGSATNFAKSEEPCANECSKTPVVGAAAGEE